MPMSVMAPLFLRRQAFVRTSACRRALGNAGEQAFASGPGPVVSSLARRHRAFSSAAPSGDVQGAEKEALIAALRALPVKDRESILHSFSAEGPTISAADEERQPKQDADLVEAPTTDQLWRYFLITLIPYIGFGFADNVLMIMAGEQIELHLGSAFHLSTFAAAGLGNWISDVIGLGLGGVIEESAEKIGLRPHRMTLAQLSLSKSKATYAFGAFWGITIGCFAGMIPLCFQDQGEYRLRVIFNGVDSDGNGHISKEELQDAFAKANFYISAEDLDKLMRTHDTDQSGDLDFEEFKIMYAQWEGSLKAAMGELATAK